MRYLQQCGSQLLRTGRTMCCASGNCGEAVGTSHLAVHYLASFIMWNIAVHFHSPAQPACSVQIKFSFRQKSLSLYVSIISRILSHSQCKPLHLSSDSIISPISSSNSTLGAQSYKHSSTDGHTDTFSFQAFLGSHHQQSCISTCWCSWWKNIQCQELCYDDTLHTTLSLPDFTFNHPLSAMLV